MFELLPYHLGLLVLGVAIILAYWLPRFVSGREPAASALLIGLGALSFGMMPGMADAISPIALPKLWEATSELCLVVGLFGVGIRIDRMVTLKRWQPTIRLLAVAMPLTIAAVALLGWYAAGMTFAGALMLGAVLAPTDPVLAGDVQVGPPLEGGEHPVRFALTTEAGLNDGLAFPFVYLALAIAGISELTVELLAEWAWRDVVYRIVIGTVGGIAAGWLLGRVLFAWPKSNALAETQSGVVAFAGVLGIYGAVELAEGYGFIAAFVSGIVLRRAESSHAFHTDLHNFAQSIEHALTALILLALGAALPALLPALNWQGALIAVALIFLVRPLIGWGSLAGSGLMGGQRFVVAFYGVRGIGSIYYLSYIGSQIELVNQAELWAIIAFTIVLSTMVHGFSAGFAVEHATSDASAQEPHVDPVTGRT